MKKKVRLIDLYISDEKEQITYGDLLYSSSLNGIYSKVKEVVPILCSKDLLWIVRYGCSDYSENVIECIQDELMRRADNDNG